MLAGENPTTTSSDLLRGNRAKGVPVWTVKVQIMPFADAPKYRFNPVRPYQGMVPQGLPADRDRQAGAGPQPRELLRRGRAGRVRSWRTSFRASAPARTKMLQGRLFAYGDAHRYRLGINHTSVPVTTPHAAQARGYGRDGFNAVSTVNGEASRE